MSQRNIFSFLIHKLWSSALAPEKDRRQSKFSSLIEVTCTSGVVVYACILRLFCARYLHFGDFPKFLSFFKPGGSCDRRGASGPPGDHRGTYWGLLRERLRSCIVSIVFFHGFSSVLSENRYKLTYPPPSSSLAEQQERDTICI